MSVFAMPMLPLWTFRYFGMLAGASELKHRTVAAATDAPPTTLAATAAALVLGLLALLARAIPRRRRQQQATAGVDDAIDGVGVNGATPDGGFEETKGNSTEPQPEAADADTGGLGSKKTS